MAIERNIGDLREIIDTYDLTPNPTNNGQPFWEFESPRPLPDVRALTSIIHASLHINRMKRSVNANRWSFGDEVVPEILCTARRVERALGSVAHIGVITEHIGATGVLEHADLFDLILAASKGYEDVVHDAMHALQADPSLDDIHTPLGESLEGLGSMWAIAIDLADIEQVDSIAVTKSRLESLARRFSNGQVISLYD